MTPLRIGILGAAKIAPAAVVEPAASIDTVEISRVAARDRGRAEAFADQHGIESVSADYADLIAADDVDVVYNPLPMSHHAHWTIAALRAGKHVLCEKPFASNADEAAEMIRVAESEDRALGEAFHYYYHPLFQRVLSLVRTGVIGSVTRIVGHFNIQVPQPDLRWEYELSGGATMDLGCYPIHMARTLVGEEPTITAARAEVGPEHIDAATEASLEFPSGATARIYSAMNDPFGRISLEVDGTAGTISVTNPVAPQAGNTLAVTTAKGTTAGQVEAGTTYSHMLRAFVDHVVHGAAFPTSGEDAVANMRTIDATYVAAGLPRRGEGRL